MSPSTRCDTTLSKSASVLVSWFGKSEPAVVRKLHASGKVQVLWPEGSVSSVERHDIRLVSDMNAKAKPDMDLSKGDAILVRWLGEWQTATVRKLHRNGKVQVFWRDGTVASVERDDVQSRRNDANDGRVEDDMPLRKGDSVVVRWHGELHSAIVRKLHNWKVQVLWGDGTVSCVGRHEVHQRSETKVRKRAFNEGNENASLSKFPGRPLKKDRSSAELSTPPRFAPPMCWHVLGPMDWRGVVFLPQFFTLPETNLVTESIESAVADLGIVPVLDRSDELKFNHIAYRIDQPFWENTALFEKVVGTMRWADDQLWNTLSWSEKQVYLEPEFIRYHGNGTSQSKPLYAIEPHVDNHSALTLVCLLSRCEDFEGGTLVFKALSPQGAARVVQMALGDAVVFRGEKLIHWVTPITSGKRDVLQVELSRI